jgi:hypothetical protein
MQLSTGLDTTVVVFVTPAQLAPTRGLAPAARSAS